MVQRRGTEGVVDEDLEAADGSALAISTLVALSSKNGGRLHHISAMMAALTSAAETI